MLSTPSAQLAIQALQPQHTTKTDTGGHVPQTCSSVSSELVTHFVDLYFLSVEFMNSFVDISFDPGRVRRLGRSWPCPTLALPNALPASAEKLSDLLSSTAFVFIMIKALQIFVEPGALDELKQEMIYVCDEAVSQDLTNVQGGNVVIGPPPPPAFLMHVIC